MSMSLLNLEKPNFGTYSSAYSRSKISSRIKQKLANFIQHFSSQNSMVPEDLGSLSRSSSTDENTFSGSDAVSYQEHWKTSDDDSKSSEVFQTLPQSTPGKSQNFDEFHFRKLKI